MAGKKPDSPVKASQLDSLLARWEASLTLHAKYASLDEERYRHVQPWPKHERPAAWIVALARQRVAALRRIVAQRQTEGDRAFIEALEMMTFVANLAGLQNVERFIPLATIENERREVLEAPRPEAVKLQSAGTGTTSNRHRRIDEPTQEMPQLPNSKVQRLLAQQRAGVSTKAIAAAQAVAKRDTKRVEKNTRAAIPGAKTIGSMEPHEFLVIDDAVRLIGWGRKWHELAELIPRLAGRPSPSETRRILRQHRAVIEKQVGIASD